MQDDKVNRRLKIIMDPERKIKPDGITNWVTDAPDDLEFDVGMAMIEDRSTFVLQPPR